MIRGKKKKSEQQENVDRWMVSYADFVTLLFCFFTAMYAISNVDTDKLGKFVRSMKHAFNAPESGGKVFSVIEEVPLVLPFDADTENIVRESMSAIMSGPKGGIEIQRDRRGVVISVSDRLFFESGSAKLRPEAKEVLEAIASVLDKIPNMIRIEGHTDNIPISSSEFPSNWELSAIRAIQTARYFITQHSISPGRVSTMGYAEQKPVASNNTPEGRAKNRRVEIIILSEQETRRKH